MAVDALRAPYWRDYLSRERTMCSLCFHQGRGWVRIGPPIPIDVHRRGKLAAWIMKQRTAFWNHVREVHPDLPVRWARDSRNRA